MENYTVVKKIGSGSFGTCLLVKDSAGKSCILKQIKLGALPSQKERDSTLREAQLLKTLQHPHIVQFIDSFVDEANNTLCIVMAFCEKGDLYHYIKSRRGQYLPEDLVLDWFIQITIALQHCHSKKVLHRDIKTQNVFITSRNTVKLGDFGIAKVLAGTLDVARSIVGSPLYMSPEILDNKAYNNKSDIWSLGCVLYELTTLKHAFDANNMNGLIFKIIRGRYPPVPSQYSLELVSLIRNMLSKDPRIRPTANQILRLPFIRKRIEHQISSTNQLSTNQSKAIPLQIAGQPLSPRSVADHKERRAQRDQHLEVAKRQRDQAQNYLQDLANNRRNRPERVAEKEEPSGQRYKIMYAAGAIPGQFRQVKVPITNVEPSKPARRSPLPIEKIERDHVPLEEVLNDNKDKENHLYQKFRRMHEQWAEKRSKWNNQPGRDQARDGQVSPRPMVQDLEKIRDEERRKEQEKRQRNRAMEEDELRRLENEAPIVSDPDESDLEREAQSLLRQSINVIHSLEIEDSVVVESFSDSDDASASLSHLENALNLSEEEASAAEEENDGETPKTDSFHVFEAQNGLLAKLSGIRQRAEKELGSETFDRLYLLARNVVDDCGDDDRYSVAEKKLVDIVGHFRRLEARLVSEVVFLEDALYTEE
ncbi:hypothetical protein GEMRC1_006573 [Eukaryota sp. GEM-RC1]